MDFLEQAACAREDPELFFPLGTTIPIWAAVDQAKAICGRCSVQPRCLTWAIENRIESGIWGGLTEEERRRMPGAAAARSRRAS
jgi:WhiB family redox-sensing transcriptional regulator